MSTNDANDASGRSIAPSELRESWRYLMGAGVLIAILGLLAIFSPFVTGIAVSVLFGAFLIVGGLGHLVHAFSARGWTGSLWQVVLAVVYGLAGVSLVLNPLLGLTTLTILLIAFLVAEGIAEVVMGLALRPGSRWGWVVGSGLVSLVLAGLLWAGFPSTALWAVGLLLGVSLLSTGITMVFVANVGRKIPAVGAEGPDADSPGV